MKKLCGWKAITVDRTSLIMSETGPAVGVFYPKRRVVTPRMGCGPLSVFKTRKGAVDFISNQGTWDYRGVFMIVRCLYTPSRHAESWYPKRGRHARLNKSIYAHVSTGTALASSVTCLE